VFQNLGAQKTGNLTLDIWPLSESGKIVHLLLCYMLCLFEQSNTIEVDIMGEKSSYLNI